MRSGERKAAEVLAFPALQRIPEPEMPLAGPAYDKYRELAESLHKSRKLNTFTRMKCEQMAIMYGQMATRISRNLPVSAKAIAEMGKLMKELQLVDESDSTAPDATESENRYARIGEIIRTGAQAPTLRTP